MKANQVQVGGEHYKASEFQPWDLMHRYNIKFLEGCAIKYISRWRNKNGVQDLEKALHFVRKLEEVADEGYQPGGGIGPGALVAYYTANGITDFREQILISILANQWDPNQLNHAVLLLNSLIESNRGETEGS